MNTKCVLMVILSSFSIVQSGIPGTFFWRPRLGLDLAIPTTEKSYKGHQLTKQNVDAGFVVAVEGYQTGMAIISLATGLASANAYPHLNPMSAYYHTNIFRWGMRHLSLLPIWLRGNSISYMQTLKAWRRRFYYMNMFMPKWMRYLFPYVDAREWDKEEIEFNVFRRHAEAAYYRHYRYPSKVFNNFKSFESVGSTDLSIMGSKHN